MCVYMAILRPMHKRVCESIMSVVRLVNILHSVQTDSRCSDTWSCLRISGLFGTPLRGLSDTDPHIETRHSATDTHVGVRTLPLTLRSLSLVCLLSFPLKYWIHFPIKQNTKHQDSSTAMKTTHVDLGNN